MSCGCFDIYSSERSFLRQQWWGGPRNVQLACPLLATCRAKLRVILAAFQPVLPAPVSELIRCLSLQPHAQAPPVTWQHYWISASLSCMMWSWFILLGFSDSFHNGGFLGGQPHHIPFLAQGKKDMFILQVHTPTHIACIKWLGFVSLSFNPSTPEHWATQRLGGYNWFLEAPKYMAWSFLVPLLSL